MHKILLFGHMPADASPAYHLAAGAWCFEGQEHLFPEWDNPKEPQKYFPLPDDPYLSPQETYAAAASANAVAAELVTRFGARLNKKYAVEYSHTFWDMALGSWLLLACHVIIERRQRVLNLIREYGTLSLQVPVLPEHLNFSFRNSRDFMVNGVQNTYFNHYLFSCLLAELAPSCWQRLALPPSPQKQNSSAQASSLKTALANWMQRWYFPRYKGIPLWMSLALSLQLRHKKLTQQWPDHPLSAYAAPLIPEWIDWAESFLWPLLPTALKPQQLPTIPFAHNKLRGMTAAFSQDDSYRLFLAAWKEGGGKLFAMQHGANYGNLASVGSIVIEYGQHTFFSWGYETHSPFPIHAVPISHPGLCKLYNTHKEQHASLILVGTEMSTHSYRLKTRPGSKALVAYRQGKCRFFAALPHELQNNSQYRPYFSVAGGLEDASYLQQQFPHIMRCSGNLDAHMCACRLLILDHYGTTLHMALVANTPVICYWPEQEWTMDKASFAALGKLRETGILHSSPERAAAHAVDIWSNVAHWWHSTAVQAARQYWIQHFAQCTIANKKATQLQVLHYWHKTLASC